MQPSNNLFALVRAYDHITQPAKTIEEFRTQSQCFLDEITHYANSIAPLFANNDKKANVQSRYDATLSIVFDIGLDLFFDSGLPECIRNKTSKSTIRAAIESIPSPSCSLRPELEEQLTAYHIPLMSRRAIEVELFFGIPLFTIGRCLSNADGKRGEIVYGVSVLHPFLRFLFGCS